MSEPTVTMTLSRYKVLEEKEKAFEQHVKSNDIILISIPYGSDYYYSSGLTETFEQMQKEIKRLEDYAEKWRLKASDCK